MRKKFIALGMFTAVALMGIGTTDTPKGLIWEKIPVEAKMHTRTFTEREEQILLTIATAEAESEHAEGMRKVMEVVLNRVESQNYPDTIEGVVFQKTPCVQFSSTTNGRYERCGIADGAMDALEAIELNGVQDKEIVAFELSTNRDLEKWYEYKYTVGCHSFYTEKGAIK